MNKSVNPAAMITDHQITLYYFIATENNFTSDKINILKGLGMPKPIIDSLEHAKEKEANIWEKAKPSISFDFLPNVKKLFDINSSDPIINHYQLSKLALNTINGQPIIHSKESAQAAPTPLYIPLKNSAMTRLKKHDIESEKILVKLQNMEIYVFRTGFTVAVINCQLAHKGLHPELLIEGIYHLAHRHQLKWDVPDCKTETSMGKLTRTLVGAPESYNRNHRAYIDTCVQLEKTIPEREHKTLLLKLARHYTDDYQINSDKVNNIFIQEFTNIVHCLAAEGCATSVTCDNHSPDFIKNYINNTRKSVHIPMQLLVFHEHQALQSYLEGTTIWVTEVFADKKLLSKLQQHQLDIQNLSLNFHQPVISRVSMHNNIYSALRETQRIDELLNKAKNDNAIVHHLISDYHEQQSRLRYCKLSKYGVSAVAFLTAITLSKEVLEVIVNLSWIGEKFTKATEWLHHWDGVINLSLATVAMLTVFFIERNQCQDKAAVQSHKPTKSVFHQLVKRRLLEHKS